MSDKAKKRPAKKQGGFFGMLAATLLIAVAFGAIIYGMYYLNIINIFDVFDSKGEVSIESPDIDNLLIAYEKPEYRFVYSVDIKELLSLVSSSSTPDKYSFHAETVDFGSSSNIVKLYAEKDGSSFKIERYSSDSDGTELINETIICDGDNITVRNNTDLRSISYQVSERFSFESYCRMPTLNDLTEICKKAYEADNHGSVDCDVSLVSSGNDSYYKVVVRYNQPEQTDEYYVSIENGMIMSAFTYINDKLVYRCIVSDYDTTSAVSAD